MISPEWSTPAGRSRLHVYQKWTNTQTLMNPLNEDREAVEVMGDILSAPGLELIGIGDLLKSSNVPGMGLRAEPVMAALERAVRYCGPHNTAVMAPPLPDLTNEYTRQVM